MRAKGVAVLSLLAVVGAAFVFSGNDKPVENSAQASAPTPAIAVASQPAARTIDPGVTDTCLFSECRQGETVVYHKQEPGSPACKSRPAAAYVNDVVLTTFASGQKPLPVAALQELAVKKGVIDDARECEDLPEGSKVVIRHLDDDFAMITALPDGVEVWLPRGDLRATPGAPARERTAGPAPKRYLGLDSRHLAAECGLRAAFFTHMVMNHDLGRTADDIMVEMDGAFAKSGVGPDGLPPDRPALRNWAKAVLGRVFAADRNDPSINYVSLQMDFAQNCGRNPEHYVERPLINWLQVRRRELLLPDVPGTAASNER